MKPVFFISDLHLCAARPRISEAFFGFLKTTAVQAQALYILGDLFEYWAGDDDRHAPLHAEVITALRQLQVDAAVDVYLMHGNRDFLMARDFLADSGAVLLEDPTLISLHGVPTLLSHGDAFCTDDVGYQAFRDTVRTEAWQQAFLSKPLAERKAIIEDMRRQSQSAQKEKAPEIMDVNQDAVAQVFRAHNYPRLIHGHTHRPQRHEHLVDGHLCERWVLPDWYEEGGYLSCPPAGCQLITIPVK